MNKQRTHKWKFPKVKGTYKYFFVSLCSFKFVYFPIIYTKIIWFLTLMILVNFRHNYF
jgi:hypothetical protein